MGAPGLHPGGPVSASESEREPCESMAIDWNRPPNEATERNFGPVAQLGERLVCIQEVVGSIPVGSTTISQDCEIGRNRRSRLPPGGRRAGSEASRWSLVDATADQTKGPIAQSG